MLAAGLPAALAAKGSGPHIGCQTNAWSFSATDFKQFLEVLAKIKSLRFEGFETSFRNLQAQYPTAAAARAQIGKTGLVCFGVHIFLNEYDPQIHIASMDLIKSTAGGGAVLSAPSYGRISGANERLGMALVVSGRRGREVMRAFLSTGRIDLRCLCDVYDVQRQRARESFKIQAPETVAIEDALGRKEVDAVLIGTPDHLHLPLSLAALEAGEHVYLEKPTTHNLETFCSADSRRFALSDRAGLCLSRRGARSGRQRHSQWYHCGFPGRSDSGCPGHLQEHSHRPERGINHE